MNIDEHRCLCGVYSNLATGKLESSHPWNSADSAVVREASLALKWCPGPSGPPGENAWPELQLRSKLRGFRDNRTGFTYSTQSIWRYMRLSGMVWHLLNCCTRSSGCLNSDCRGNVSISPPQRWLWLFEHVWSPFCTMCLKFPKFLYMRFFEQTADKRCKSKIQKLLFNASPWIRAELPSISEHRYRFLGPDWTGCKTRRLASSLLQATGAGHKDLREHWLWPRWRTKLRLWCHVNKYMFNFCFHHMSSQSIRDFEWFWLVAFVRTALHFNYRKRGSWRQLHRWLQAWRIPNLFEEMGFA